MTKLPMAAIAREWVQRTIRNVASPPMINAISTVMARYNHENDSLNRRLQATQSWHPKISRKYSFQVKANV